MENSFSSREILNIAVRIEQNGHDFYKKMSDKSDDKTLSTLFNDLADWETQHKTKFQEMLSKVPDDDFETLSSYGFSEETFLYLNAIADSHVFPPDKDFGLSTKKDLTHAFAIAMALEKDSIIFYYELLSFMSDTHKNTIEEIIREEKKHLLFLAEKRKMYI